MSDKFEFIENPLIQGEILEGFASILGGKYRIKVTLDIEQEPSKIEDFKPLAKIAFSRIKLLNNDILEGIKNKISIEITEASYSQTNYSAKDEDFHNLNKELEINQINFYEEDLVMVFSADKNFPDCKIYCQINDAFEIENIEILDV